MSQHKFSRAIGVHRTTISYWENGTTGVPKWAVILAKLFAAKRQALITGQRPTLNIASD